MNTVPAVIDCRKERSAVSGLVCLRFLLEYYLLPKKLNQIKARSVTEKERHEAVMATFTKSSHERPYQCDENVDVYFPLLCVEFSRTPEAPNQTTSGRGDASIKHSRRAEFPFMAPISVRFTVIRGPTVSNGRIRFFETVC